MAHSHSHSSVQAPDNSNARRLLWAFIVTAGFMLIEAVGGAISGSLALLADAGHMLTDSAALLFALLAVRFASRPPNARHTFGPSCRRSSASPSRPKKRMVYLR